MRTALLRLVAAAQPIVCHAQARCPSPRRVRAAAQTDPDQEGVDFDPKPDMWAAEGMGVASQVCAWHYFSVLHWRVRSA